MNDVLESIRLSIKYSYSLHSECVVIEFTLLNLCMRLTICRSDLSYVTLSSMPLLWNNKINLQLHLVVHIISVWYLRTCIYSYGILASSLNTLKQVIFINMVHWWVCMHVWLHSYTDTFCCLRNPSYQILYYIPLLTNESWVHQNGCLCGHQWRGFFTSNNNVFWTHIFLVSCLNGNQMVTRCKIHKI